MSAPAEGGTGKSAVATVPLAPAVWIRYATMPERVRLGNRVQLLRDGAATFPAMLDAIAGAKRHVNLASYTFAGDTTGRIFAAALAEKAKAGVEVNVLYDAFGSGDTPLSLF